MIDVLRVDYIRVPVTDMQKATSTAVPEACAIGVLISRRLVPSRRVAGSSNLGVSS